MKNQDLFSSKDKIKKLKCRLLQFLFSALRVKFCFEVLNSGQLFKERIYSGSKFILLRKFPIWKEYVINGSKQVIETVCLS